MRNILTLVAFMIVHVSGYAQAWIEVGTGNNALKANNTIWTTIADPVGNIYAAGGFTDSATYIGGYSYVARWNDTTWTMLGTGASALNANNAIYAMMEDIFGNIYAAGDFTDPNGRQYVAKWNGTAWSELGVDTLGLNATEPIFALAADGGGTIYAAGAFTDLVFAFDHYYVAKWTGATWTEVGLDSLTGLNANDTILALATDRPGNLYAAGAFTDSNGYYYVAKWNGTVWSELGTDSAALNANGQINTVITDTFGNVYAAGDFTDTLGYYYIAKWNGHTWTELSNPNAGGDQINIRGQINTLTLDSVGNVYAAGWIPDSTGAYFLVVEWNGSRLIVANNNGNGPLMANAPVASLCADKYGNIYAAGSFTDDSAYSYVAEFTGNIPSGIKTVSSSSLLIYPNPTSGILFIQADDLSGMAAMEICDGLGRSLARLDTRGAAIPAQIDLSGYAPGVYTLWIREVSGMTLTRRIVKD